MAGRDIDEFFRERSDTFACSILSEDLHIGTHSPKVTCRITRYNRCSRRSDPPTQLPLFSEEQGQRVFGKPHLAQGLMRVYQVCRR
jgi:hypothetical protein